VYAYVNNGKLAPRAIKCMFLGYASESTSAGDQQDTSMDIEVETVTVQGGAAD